VLEILKDYDTSVAIEDNKDRKSIRKVISMLEDVGLDNASIISVPVKFLGYS